MISPLKERNPQKVFALIDEVKRLLKENEGSRYSEAQSQHYWPLRELLKSLSLGKPHHAPTGQRTKQKAAPHSGEDASRAAFAIEVHDIIPRCRSSATLALRSEPIQRQFKGNDNCKKANDSKGNNHLAKNPFLWATYRPERTHKMGTRTAGVDFLNQALSDPDNKGFIMTFDAVQHGTGFMTRDELMQAKLNLRQAGRVPFTMRAIWHSQNAS